MALSQTSVLKLYNTVIDDVINGVKDSLCTEEGVDEGVLEELRQIWESKLIQSKAVEINSDPPEPQPPQITILKNNAANKGVTSSNAANVGNHFAQQQMQAVSTTTQSQSHVQQQTPQQLIQTQSQSQSQPARVANQQTTNLPVQQHATMPVQVVTTPALFERQVPIQITLPGNASTGDGKPKILTIHVPASAIQSNQLHTILTGPVITAAMGFPESVASKLLQQHVDKTLQAQATLPIEINQVITQANNVQQQLPVQNQAQGNIAQLDGPHGDTSDDEDDEDEEEENDDDDDDIEKDDDEQDDAGAREEEPLNSEDDVTDDDPTDLFDTDNVVVCQYDKITRSRNKWKFYLKDGIMNLSGKDYVFQKANGDAEW
ncbi:transcription initiation factor IIA subunit 1 [Microplitis demolitor]|uniref:transcription initiation factor IIA subunit 1 n=1 Tax=Microplitis demolitor TaxID=69319 RepID=UPI0004CD50AE|nr:transcription initiation factor IIA subunit 1 [Microplitis demolitor]